MTKSVAFLMSFICLIAFSCSKEKSTENSGIFQYDVDAKKFLDSAGIKSDTVQMKAVNALVIQLKDSGLWTKFTAIYPMVGGTAKSTKLNLKDPREIDEAYRLTFSGNPVFSSTGVLFPTNADYADTHLYDSTMEFNNNSISYYSRTQNSVSGYDIGCVDNQPPYNEMAIYHASNATDYFGLYRYGYTPEKTIGLFLISTSSEDVVWYENGTATYKENNPPRNEFTGYSLLIGWCRGADSGGHRECSFATIGKGLLPTEVQAFSKIVSKYQINLNR